MIRQGCDSFCHTGRWHRLATHRQEGRCLQHGVSRSWACLVTEVTDGIAPSRNNLSGREVYALTSSSVDSEIDSWVFAASRRALGAKEADLRFKDVACTSNRLAPARGIVLAGFVGVLLWITLIAGAYFLVEGLML